MTAIIFIVSPAINTPSSCKVEGKEVYGVATACVCLSLKCMADTRFEQGGVEQRRIQDLHRRSEKVDNIRYYNQTVGTVMKT